MRSRAGAATALALLVACTPPPGGAGSADRPSPAAAVPRTASPAATGTGSPTPGPLLDVLAGLPVRPRGERTGYDRDLFGPAWADVDRNGCGTRDDVLRRDLEQVEVRDGTRGCVVVAGVLEDPYTGTVLAFRKADAGQVQVDHVVSLSDAWQTGARTWSAERRLAFANDPLNLLAVSAAANQAKRDADAATWLPPHRPGRCRMVALQVAVKAKWELWVKPAEQEAAARVLGSCPPQPLLSGGLAVPPTRAAAPAEPAPAAAGGLDPDHGSCRRARAVGDGPYVAGVDPEYAWYVDGDGDGTVCE